MHRAAECRPTIAMSLRKRHSNQAAFLLLAVALPLSTLHAEAPPVPTQRVGQPLEIRDLYLPGGEVKPTPRRDRKPPLMVRILEVKPAKDGSRYDFEVQGLEAGSYNLADFLEAPAGTTLPAIPLEITSALPPGITYPHDIPPGNLPELGGYRTMMILLGSLWLAGLAVILVWRKKKLSTTGDSTQATATLAERLHPLVDAASKGELASDDRAKLERLVIGHWREHRPDIAALPPAEAMVKLRSDPQAAPLFLALERWLHARSSETTKAEIDQLLAPYGDSGRG
jgi:hypothetical protein